MYRPAVRCPTAEEAARQAWLAHFFLDQRSQGNCSTFDFWRLALTEAQATTS